MSDSDQLKKIGEGIASAFPQMVNKTRIAHGELALEVPANMIRQLVSKLRDDTRFGPFEQLTDICAVDFPGEDQRFNVIYHLLSLSRVRRLRLRVKIAESESIPSLVEIFPVANWFEREVFDMYGVAFVDHPDLRRLLTDYNFDGYPLRKDFPLTGHVEVRYDNDQKRVVYEPVQLNQDYRDFDFESPWEQDDSRMLRDAARDE